MTTQNLKYLAAILSIAAISAELSAESQTLLPIKKLVFTEQQLEIKVEMATRLVERERGLMYRSNLDAEQGMLFVYTDQSPRSVWMKNTLIPLDILFLAADGSILTMLDNLPPCQDDPCPIYNSKVSAKYMLELNAGFIKDHQLKIDQKVRLP